MEAIHDNLPAVTTQTQGVRNNPAGAANLAIEQPDPRGLRRDSIPTTAQVAADLLTLEQAWQEAEVVDGKRGVFCVERMILMSEHSGYQVMAEGTNDEMHYQDDGTFRGNEYWPATLDLGFVGREELCESWGDRLAEVAEAELGRYHKVGRAATFAVLVQT